jgi:D-tagatose-1,6-bisphosphate aldolase subunit GatZ/KbaZ
MAHLLDDIVRAQKAGEVRGIPSICSAHPAVLTCALRHFRPVLIESTCNQVNQYGGYTGMTPRDFRRFVNSLAEETSFPRGELILGGDHLGPSPWQDLPAKEAMSRAEELVRSYARAGFTKLHIDASMKLGGDDLHQLLSPELSAQRTARLVRVAEEVAEDASSLRYVIGTEVPLPGGAHEHEEGVEVTRAEDVGVTLQVTRLALKKLGYGSAWERVIALVVQPGVEYGSDFILEYDPGKAFSLAKASEATQQVFEAHSTDYQSPSSLGKLVRDHFAILKVGPALTFAYREAIFALAGLEDVLIPEDDRSNLVTVIEEAMLHQPEHWRDHYKGTFKEQAYQRKFSLSDRIRYYWKDPAVVEAVMKLLKNLEGRDVSLKVLKNILPKLRGMNQKSDADLLIDNRVLLVLDEYYAACGFKR